MKDLEYQKYHLERIFSGWLFAPVFKHHPELCINQFEKSVPFISYDDVHDYNYIIRGRPLMAENNHFDSEPREIIAEYKSIDELVNAGWRLD